MDMDAFFAAVEQRRRPELKGKPVVIGGSGDPTRRGVVSTASYEARKFGIHSAMPLATAYRLCPDAVYLPVDYAEYSRVSRIVKKILFDVTPLMEDVGIDEAFLDISLLSKSPEEISDKLKKRIREQTDLTCSIGIAPNKLLAKIASDMEKPDGLTVITEEDIESRIWPLAARRLRGVGPKTEEALRKRGIHTIGELAALSLENLTDRFGPSFGGYLFDASRGRDESPLITHWEPKSTGREITFQHDVSAWQDIAKTLAGLTRRVVTEMKEDGYRGQTVTVKVRFSDFETYTRARTLEGPTDSLEEIRKAAFHCLNRFDLKKRVRLIGIRMSKLEKY